MTMDRTGDFDEDVKRLLPMKFSILEDDLDVQAFELKRSVNKDVFVDNLARKHSFERKIELRNMRSKPVFASSTADKLPHSVEYTEPVRLYWTHLECDTRGRFPLTRIYDYRGDDAHPMFKDGHGKVFDRRPSLILIHGGSTFGHPDHKVKEAPDALYHFCDFSPRPDSQVSVFIIWLRRPSTMISGNAPLWVRFEVSAGCLVRTAEDVGVHFALADDKVKVNMPDIPVLHELADKRMLLRTNLNMWTADSKPTGGAIAKPIWHDLEVNELDSIRQRAADPATTLSHFERVIIELDAATSLSIYSEVKGEARVRSLPQCFDYIRAISYATANAGFYWWFVLAANISAIDDGQYPLRDAYIGIMVLCPRWLVDVFRVSYTGRRAVSYKPEHITESFFNEDILQQHLTAQLDVVKAFHAKVNEINSVYTDATGEVLDLWRQRPGIVGPPPPGLLDGVELDFIRPHFTREEKKAMRRVEMKQRWQ